MQEVLVAMAIMGCGDAGAACQTIEVVEANFRSMRECEEAAPDVLFSLTDLDYPEVMVHCLPKLQVASLAQRASRS